MRPAAALALAVVTLVIGVVVGTFISPGRDPDAGPPPDSVQAENQRLQEEVARLQTTLGEERKAVKAGQAPAASAESAPDAPDAASGSSETETEEVEKSGPRFFGDRFQGVLRKIDWDTVGSNLGEMVELITELMPSLRRGETPPAKTIGRISQLNGGLLAAALQLQEDLPGTGVNGKFTDPAFMVNAMAATLEATEAPLSADQQKALEEVARTWMAADERRRQGYDENTYGLRQLYEEAELKGKFFEDAFARLTPGQVELLSPEDTRGRVRVDLFSSGLLYAALARPTPFTTDDELVEACLQGATGLFRFSAEERESARQVISVWASAVPRDLVDRETNALDLQGLVHVDRVNAWARHSLDLVKSLESELELDEDRRNRGRQARMVPVPIRRPAD
jgi:hypothetical protein